jgi:hypothetical protein
MALGSRQGDPRREVRRRTEFREPPQRIARELDVPFARVLHLVPEHPGLREPLEILEEILEERALRRAAPRVNDLVELSPKGSIRDLVLWGSQQTLGARSRAVVTMPP